MGDVGKAVGVLALINAVIPHEIDAAQRDSDCIAQCKRCKELGADKSPTGNRSYCFICPLYVYSFMTK